MLNPGRDGSALSRHSPRISTPSGRGRRASPLTTLVRLEASSMAPSSTSRCRKAAQGHQRAHDAYLNEDHERRRPRVLDALLNFAEERGQLVRPESAERLEHGAVYQARGGPNSTTPRPPRAW